MHSRLQGCRATKLERYTPIPIESLKAFISHNEADKDTARLLAVALVEHGIDVWFDEWAIRPGDSITGGIERGLAEADTLVLLWSAPAQKSNWIGTEVRAYVRRRVDEHTLRIVPVMIDATPLPVLVADYRGFKLDTMSDLRRIAGTIVGPSDMTEVAQRLQKRLHQLAAHELPAEDPIKVLVCPKCASKCITRTSQYDGYADSIIHFAICEECTWGEARKPSKPATGNPHHA